MPFVRGRERCTVPAEVMTVEVAYALPARQILLPVEVAVGATVEQALQQSGVLEKFPEIDLASNKVGVFGKLSKLDAVLKAGDRVEVYRALIADPKDRKARAQANKKSKQGGEEPVDVGA